MTSAAAALVEREKRLADACRLSWPDRVPVAPLVHYFPAWSLGVPHKVRSW